MNIFQSKTNILCGPVVNIASRNSIEVNCETRDEASFRSVRYLEVKIRCKNALGPRIVSAVRSLEVVASRRLPMYMYYKYRKSGNFRVRKF